MNQKKTLILLAIIIPMGLVATAIWSFGNKTVTKPEKKVKPKASIKINKNEWLRSDFERITEFYKSPFLHYKARYSYYSGGTEKADNITSAELWMSHGNYLYESDNNLVMRNNAISIMLDYASKVMLVDSAFDAGAFTPGGLDLDSALSRFDSISRDENPGYFVYSIPGMGLGVHHTLMEVRKSDMAITRMTIYALDDENAGAVVKKMEMVFSGISTAPDIDSEYFITSNYVLKTGNTYAPVNRYSSYKIITKQTLQ